MCDSKEFVFIWENKRVDHYVLYADVRIISCAQITSYV